MSDFYPAINDVITYVYLQSKWLYDRFHGRY